MICNLYCSQYKSTNHNTMSNKSLTANQKKMEHFVFWILRNTMNNGVLDESIFNSIIDHLANRPIDQQIEFHVDFNDNYKIIYQEYLRVVFPNLVHDNTKSKRRKSFRKTKSSTLITHLNTDNYNHGDDKDKDNDKDNNNCHSIVSAANLSDEIIIHFQEEEDHHDVPGFSSSLDSFISQTNELSEDSYDIIIESNNENIKKEKEIEVKEIEIDQVVEIVDKKESNKKGEKKMVKEKVPKEKVPKEKIARKKVICHEDVDLSIIPLGAEGGILKGENEIDGEDDSSKLFFKWFLQHFHIHPRSNFCNKNFTCSFIHKLFISSHPSKFTVKQCRDSLILHIGLRKNNHSNHSFAKLSRGIFDSNGTSFIQGWHAPLL